MIDCENEVFTMVAQSLRTAFPGIDVASEYIPEPASFPHVSIYMADSYNDLRDQTGSLQESMSTMMFQVDVYSNKTHGKKTECKAINKHICDLLFAHNFVRSSSTPTPNMSNATIYRITSRFRVVSDGEHFYRR
jgi:hypothetical protein